MISFYIIIECQDQMLTKFISQMVKYRFLLWINWWFITFTSLGKKCCFWSCWRNITNPIYILLWYNIILFSSIFVPTNASSHSSFDVDMAWWCTIDSFYIGSIIVNLLVIGIILYKGKKHVMLEYRSDYKDWDSILVATKWHEEYSLWHFMS